MINKRINKCMNLFVTNICNLKCEYCDIPTIDKNKLKSITMDDIPLIDSTIDYCLSNYNFELNNKTMSFLGGEIGVLDRSIILELIKITNKYTNRHRILWITNGLIIEKVPEILNEDIDIDIHFTNLKQKMIAGKNISYTIIETTDNSDFVKKQKEICMNNKVNFSIKPCNDIRSNYNKSIGLNSTKFKTKFFNKYDCDKKSLYFSIDFANKTLYKCSRSYVRFETKELNNCNLNLALKGQLFKHSPICDKCIRLASIRYDINYLNGTYMCKTNFGV